MNPTGDSARLLTSAPRGLAHRLDVVYKWWRDGEPGWEAGGCQSTPVVVENLRDWVCGVARGRGASRIERTKCFAAVQAKVSRAGMRHSDCTGGCARSRTESGVLGVHRILRPDPADRGAFRVRRTDLRRGEERHCEGVRQSLGHDADDGGRLSITRRRLLGSWVAWARSRSELPYQPVHLPSLRLRRAHRWSGTGLERRVPDAARADYRRVCRQQQTGARPPRGQHHDWHTRHPDQRLVSAIPESFGRYARLRPGWRIVRVGRGGCQLYLC